MRIEHFGYNVEQPREVAAWYAQHLGFTTERAGGEPNYAHFVADETGGVMIEIYNNPACPVPDYERMDPLALHLAVLSDDIDADVARLTRAGARVVDPRKRTASGDDLCMLRDPWGFALQLIHRAEPMIR